MRTRILQFFALVAALLLGASTGGAETIVEKGRTQVDVGGAVKASLIAQDGNPNRDALSAEMTGARIYARGIHHDWGQVFVQTDLTLEPAILDGFVHLDYFDPISVRIGRFWVPFIRETDIGYTALNNPGRTRLLQLAPGRKVGFNATGSFDFDGWGIRLDAGIFNPSNDLVGTDPGMIMNERLLVQFDFGLNLHVAYLQHILASDTETAQVYPNNKALNAAIHYEKDGVRALAEGVYIFDGPFNTNPMGLYGILAYTFGGQPGEHGWQPAASVDYIDRDDGTTLTRIQANFAWLIVGPQLQIRGTYGLEFHNGSDDLGHTGTLQFQGAF